MSRPAKKRNPPNLIRPIGIAPVGLAIEINGQRFDLVAHEQVTNKRGDAVTLMVWQAECPTCGEGFHCKTIAGRFAETRRCEKRRQPGKRVPRQ